jgi:hypothetical protein
MTTYNFSDLYKKQFGIYVAQGITSTALDAAVAKTKQLQLSTPDFVVDQRGFLGAPLMMPIKLDDFQLPNEPLISITGGRNIVSTPINGVNGEFKEEWSLRDYTITIRGFLIDEGNPETLPETQIRALRSILEKSNSRKIVCKLTTLLNIQLITITEWELPEAQASIGMMPYIIKGVSDKEYELEIKTV